MVVSCSLCASGFGVTDRSTPAVNVGYTLYDRGFRGNNKGQKVAQTKRNERSGVVDRWYSRAGAPTSRHGKGLRWQARFVDKSGTENAKSFRLKEEAKAWLNEQTAAVTRGDFVHRSRSSMTVGKMAETWLDALSAKKQSTRDGYVNRWRTHVEPRWGSVALRDVDHEDIVSWVASLTNVDGTEMSASSKQACWGVLNQILALALKAKRLSANPAAGVELPKNDSGAMVVLDYPQLVKLAEAAGGEDGLDSERALMILVLGQVGLRFGELTALRIKDVDFERCRMFIRRNIVEVSGKLVEGSPKSGKTRTVNFRSHFVPALKTLCEGRAANAFVFQQGGRDAEGVSKPLRRTNWVSRVFYPAAVEAGFVDEDGEASLSPHDLRHTAAATMIRAGANVMQVQRQLGHSRPAITLNVYAFLFEEDLSAVGDALDAAYGPIWVDAGDGDDNVVAIRSAAG